MSTPLKPPPTELPPQPAQVEAKRTDPLRITASLNALDLEYRRSWQRLSQEVAAINQRNTIDLIIGVTATAIAVGILLLPIVLGTSPVAYPAAWAHVLTRTPVCLLLEAFSFFFLRRYNAGPGETRYYQNELTNLDYRFTALRQAVQADDEVALRAALAALVKTERNFILKKGDSTVELERSRVEAQSSKELVAMIAKIVKEGK
jgi:hypothetical protein